MTDALAILTIGRATDPWDMVAGAAPLLATGITTEPGPTPVLAFVLAEPSDTSPAWQAWERLPRLIMQAYHEDLPIVLRVLFPDDRLPLSLEGMIVQIQTTASGATLTNAQGEDLLPPRDALSTEETMGYLLTEAHGVRGGRPHTWGLTLKLDRRHTKDLSALLA